MCVLHICLLGRPRTEWREKFTNICLVTFPSHLPQKKNTRLETYMQCRNSTEHLKAKSFIYSVTTSYTFPESFHSYRPVTQDKSIQHIAIKTDFHKIYRLLLLFFWRNVWWRNTWILFFKSLHSPQPTKSFNRFSKWKAEAVGINRAM